MTWHRIVLTAILLAGYIVPRWLFGDVPSELAPAILAILAVIWRIPAGNAYRAALQRITGEVPAVEERDPLIWPEDEQTPVDRPRRNTRRGP